jgi:hypothetical protein
VSESVEQHVLGLHVSVDDVLRVQVMQSQRQLRRVEAHHAFRETARQQKENISANAIRTTHAHVQLDYLTTRHFSPSHFLEVEEQFAPGAVVGDHVQLVGGLKGIPQLQHERTAHDGHNASLGHGVVHLLALLHLPLLQSLHIATAATTHTELF